MDNLPSSETHHSSLDNLTKQQELTGNDPNDTNRKRIRVACDSCRRKKIKCNGSYPCGNCIQAKNTNNCHFTERPMRKKLKQIKQENKSTAATNSNGVSKRKHKDVFNGDSNNVNTVKQGNTFGIVENKPSDIESRLSRIENSMSRMMHTIESISQNFITQAMKSNHSSSSIFNNNSLSPTPSEDFNKSRSDSEEQRTSQTYTNLKDHAKDANELLKLRNWDEFVGTHSITCIFSRESLDWMEKTLGAYGEEYLTPIRNLPLVFHSELKPYILKWIDPPVVDKLQRKKLLESPFPIDSKLISKLIDLYYEETSMINILVDESRVRSLFAAYYNNFAEPVASKRRRFRLSELLLMTSILLISLSCLTEDDFNEERIATPTSSTSSNYSAASANLLGDYSKNKLLALQNSLENSAIFYYHRISVISEGLETVEALLMFIIYVESNWLTSFFNYTIITVTIRFAQEIGLHRAETYFNLDIEEATKRRKIWWFCYFFDIEFCFKSGKPPVINTNDVTTNSDEDLLRVINQLRQYGPLSPKDRMYSPVCHTISTSLLDLSGADSICLEILRIIQMGDVLDDPFYFQFCALLQSRIRSNSYHDLFIASAEKRDFSAISNTLEKLNADMFELAMYLADEAKPRFYNDPKFTSVQASNSTTIKRDTILAMKLTFFSHLMIINRYPLMIVTEDSKFDDRVIKFRNLSLDSAKTILMLIRGWHRESASALFYNWAIYFPVAAYLVLVAAIINHPQLPESGTNLNLLIETSLNFFKSSKQWNSSNNTQKKQQNNTTICVNKIVAIELIVRLMLRVVIKVYELHNNVEILANNPTLQNHLQEAQEKFPDIFQNHAEFTSKMVALVGASPFSGGSGNCNGSSCNLRDGYASHGQNTMYPSPKVPNNTYNTNISVGSSSTGDHQVYHAQSPSYNASLSNIINNESTGRSPATATATAATTMSQPMMNENYDLFNDYLIDNSAVNLPFSQFNNLPNFFFDNNLGI
ncbi:zinc finger-containing transcription factor, putative [Candida dubliniensis CD36]|uniref:Zinc finger-containing transcription factor, putative n=1 Tax=Candida dubliniensis (strain CD36 / ATCC MYA-646 / CBS 7987 / NCPF 3949 / NRRL Y-17841) TaxID=573826 RepID=B9WHB2_CANDC|nr:zinc finger-containing transcription factor, putative [Candida dubliniensis CD36]CAX41554.1 zinc finger-containing transcription factor, putative [Candida dubliniensis CD36]